jgi:hypothetical protein
MGRIFKVITRGGAILMVTVVVIYLGACTYANVIQPKISGPKIPDATKAPYIFTEKNTGQKVLADSYYMEGRVYVLDDYWQMTKNGGFRLVKRTLKLDPRYFGPIEVQKRKVTANAG